MEVVINIYSGFGLSDKAIQHMIDNGMSVEYVEKWEDVYDLVEIYHIKEKQEDEWGNGSPFYLTNDRKDEFRANPLLIKAVKELGEEADGEHARLKIIEIPDDIEWEIYECDSGIEWIAEKHRTWWYEGDYEEYGM